MGMKTRAALYSRVSTSDQNTEGQEAELKEYAKNRGWEVTRTYRDKMSGAKSSRPALDELIADARKRKMDIVLVWRFDRFARSVSHLLQALETFRTVGIEFVSISEQVDTCTPTGKMVFTVLGAVAELERSLIAERVRMGLQSARKKGKRLGRPPIRKLTAAEVSQVKVDRATGKFSLRDLAAKYGTSVWAMQQATIHTELHVPPTGLILNELKRRILWGFSNKPFWGFPTRITTTVPSQMRAPGTASGRLSSVLIGDLPVLDRFSPILSSAP